MKKKVNKLFLLAAMFAMEAVLLGQTSLEANAQGTTTVTAESAKIRSLASTSSEVKASASKNAKLDVLSQTTDSNGYTWYKVYVNGTDTGYIRADLVAAVEGSVETESAPADTAQVDNTPSTNEGQAVDFVQVNASTVTGAKVTGGSVNVRSNPTTGASVAGKATEGTEVTVLGEAIDAEGKTWYQVSYGDVSGFIRSDFLEVTATQEPQEEVVAEPEVEEPQSEDTSVNKEYELVYEANQEGVEEWFLYDHNRGTKQSLEDMLAVVRQTKDSNSDAASQVKTYKLIMIIMIAVILALIIGVTVLVFKLRDSYEYEDDEDEDDEDEDDTYEDEDEDEDDEDEEEDEEPVRRKSFKKHAAAAAKAPIRVKSITTPSKDAPEPKRESSAWQSKNFLDIDDDMEFEFLDIK